MDYNTRYKPPGIEAVELELHELYIRFSLKNNIIDYRIKHGEEIKDYQQFLQRILGEAIIVGNEVIYLIRGGFFNGSQARVRTLHEYCKIICFIMLSKDVEIASMRYNFYNEIGIMKSLDSKIDYETSCDLKSYFNEYLENKEIDNIIHCKNYTDIRYNWASCEIKKSNKKNIRLFDIERYVHDKKIDIYKQNNYTLTNKEKKFTRDVYKFSSLNVHAGFLPEVEYTPNIIGNTQNINEKIVIEKLGSSLNTLDIYLTELQLILQCVGYWEK